MKRFIVFVVDNILKKGGVDDIEGSYDSMHEIVIKHFKRLAEENNFCNLQILDTNTGSIKRFQWTVEDKWEQTTTIQQR